MHRRVTDRVKGLEPLYGLVIGKKDFKIGGLGLMLLNRLGSTIDIYPLGVILSFAKNYYKLII